MNLKIKGYLDFRLILLFPQICSSTNSDHFQKSNLESTCYLYQYLYITSGQQKMIFLKAEEKQEIQQRIKSMNPIFKNHRFIIFLFQALGTAILAYGISVSQYKHPIKREEPNPFMTFLVSCFLYLGIAIAAPFTGGHLNPSVTAGVTAAGLSEKKEILFYMVSQIFGALLGVLIYFIFLGTPPEIYSEIVDSREIILDAVSEAFGTFIFLFGIIYVCKRNYTHGEYFKYLFIVSMLLLGRTFTFRKGCLNPAVGIAFQFFAAISHGDITIFFQIFGICLGSIIGGLAAAWFFNSFYEPLLNELEEDNEKQQQ